MLLAVDLDDPGALDDMFPISGDWSAPGHPEHSCGMPYCELDERQEGAGIKRTEPT